RSSRPLRGVERPLAADALGGREGTAPRLSLAGRFPAPGSLRLVLPRPGLLVLLLPVWAARGSQRVPLRHGDQPAHHGVGDVLPERDDAQLHARAPADAYPPPQSLPGR